jgi:hypothetical protein
MAASTSASVGLQMANGVKNRITKHQLIRVMKSISRTAREGERERDHEGRSARRVDKWRHDSAQPTKNSHITIVEALMIFKEKGEKP